MQNSSEEGYQIAALVFATLTVIVVIFYLLIFANPRIAFNPLKPPLPAPILVALATALPSTWTPTLAPIETTTSTLTPTFLPTVVPTNIPNPPTRTSTSVPTHAPTNTSIAPTRTSTRTPSPTGAAPTLIPSPYSYKTVLSCTHSGGTYIKGTVTSGGQPQEGVRVRVATSPDSTSVIEGGEQITRRQTDGSAAYSFTLKPIGAFDSPAIWYVWIVDATGSPVSDPNFHFQTNKLPQSDPQACWLAVVDFVK